MALIYTKDLLPIVCSAIFFSLLAVGHRVLIPNKYSSFLQFKQDEDVKRTAQSTAIRILYLMLGTIVLYYLCGFTNQQIAIGIFISCFLNIWPAIIQYQLLRMRKSKAEWLLLFGYICFIGFSILVAEMTIEVLLPILKGEEQLFWLDNQFISILAALITIIIPVPAEMILAKFTHVVIIQKIDTFLEEVYILEKQLNMRYPQLESDKYLIDDVAKECNINVKLLKTILQLEIIYRERMYYRGLEWFLCRFLKGFAVRKDISVGIAQIKISTAQKILRQNPKDFIQELTKNEVNIKICGKYLRQLIERYGYLTETGDFYVQEHYHDVFDYIACEYLGGIPETKERTVLIYSAVLRSVLSELPLSYMGSKEREEYTVLLYMSAETPLSYEEFRELTERLCMTGMIKRSVFAEQVKMELEIYCQDVHSVRFIKSLADEYKLMMKLE